MTEIKSIETILNDLEKEGKGLIEEEQLKELFDSIVKESKKREEDDCDMCEICCDDLTNENRIIIKPCGHGNICIECIKDYVKDSLNRNECNIRCPVNGCNQEISLTQLLGKFIDSDELKNLYLLASTRSYLNKHNRSSTQCMTCHTEMLRLTDETKMECPKCKSVFCGQCQTKPYHEGKTCEENENDELFREWMKNNGVISPKCGLGCQLMRGCNWVYCNPSVGTVEMVFVVNV